MKIARRADHTWWLFFERTAASQLHGLGSLLLLIEAFILIPFAREAGSDHLWACACYLITGILVFTVSSVYHLLHDGFEIPPATAERLENLDHFVIYLFIAGTYSPFLINTVSENWRSALLLGIWSIAIVGILYTWLKPRLPQVLQHRALYTGLFVAMSGLLLIRAGEVFGNLSNGQLGLLGGGAASYLLGACVYAFRWPSLFKRYFGYHELWHLMVLMGAQFHFFLVLSFYRSR